MVASSNTKREHSASRSKIFRRESMVPRPIPNPRLGGQTLPVHPEVRLQEYGDAPDRHRGLEAAYSFQSL